MSKEKFIWLNIFLFTGILLAAWAATVWIDKSNILSAPSAAESTDLGALHEFSFTDIKGKTHATSDFEGKIVILNFWASWCAPCVKEFPYLIEIAEKQKDNVIFIALSSDIDEATITNFQKRMKFKWDRPNIYIAHDKNDVTGKIFKTYRLPETLIIDKNQKIRKKLVGADWSADSLNALIEKMQ